jgi:serine/threonine protein kinase
MPRPPLPPLPPQQPQAAVAAVAKAAGDDRGRREDDDRPPPSKWEAKWAQMRERACPCFVRRPTCPPTVSQRYRLDTYGALGRGRYGVVLRAVPTTLATKRRLGGAGAVAIKRVARDAFKPDEVLCAERARSGEHGDATFLHAFLRVYEHAVEDPFAYVVMELFPHRELYERISEASPEHEGGAARRPYLPGEVVHLSRQLLGAVAHLHARGIVHRDLKPENLLYAGPPAAAPARWTWQAARLVVVDFGYARAWPGVRFPPAAPPPLDKDTDASLSPVVVAMRTYVGTAYYLAPEIVHRRPYTHLCDEWSAGVVLYVLLHGYPPFNGLTDCDVVQQIKRQSRRVRYDPAVEVRQPELGRATRRLLVHDPTRRAEACEVLGALPPPSPDVRIANGDAL